MVSALPEPLNAKCAAKPVGARCGVPGTFAKSGTEATELAGEEEGGVQVAFNFPGGMPSKSVATWLKMSRI